MANVLVTGSNRGIGLSLCRLFRGRGDRVLAVCRSPSPALVELGAEVLDGVDGTADADVAALARRLDGERLDVVVLNAGILREDRLADVDLDDVVEQLQV